MEIKGTCMYIGFDQTWPYDEDGGEIELQLEKETIKVKGYEHDVAGLKKGDMVKVSLEPENYGFIYLKSISYDGEQEILKRIFKNYAYDRN